MRIKSLISALTRHWFNASQSQILGNDLETRRWYSLGDCLLWKSQSPHRVSSNSWSKFGRKTIKSEMIISKNLWGHDLIPTWIRCKPQTTPNDSPKITVDGIAKVSEIKWSSSGIHFIFYCYVFITSASNATSENGTSQFTNQYGFHKPKTNIILNGRQVNISCKMSSGCECSISNADQSQEGWQWCGMFCIKLEVKPFKQMRLLFIDGFAVAGGSSLHTIIAIHSRFIVQLIWIDDRK